MHLDYKYTFTPFFILEFIDHKARVTSNYEPAFVDLVGGMESSLH